MLEGKEHEREKHVGVSVQVFGDFDSHSVWSVSGTVTSASYIETIQHSSFPSKEFFLPLTEFMFLELMSFLPIPFYYSICSSFLSLRSLSWKSNTQSRKEGIRNGMKQAVRFYQQHSSFFLFPFLSFSSSFLSFSPIPPFLHQHLVFFISFLSFFSHSSPPISFLLPHVFHLQGRKMF